MRNKVKIDLGGNEKRWTRRPACDFEWPGDRVLIHREGDKLIIEPVKTPANIFELLAAWKQEQPLGPDDRFPDIEEPPVRPEDVF